MTNDLARSITNYYTTVATTYLDTVTKMYAAQMALVTELGKLNTSNPYMPKN
jgi:hypothetical protein